MNDCLERNFVVFGCLSFHSFNHSVPSLLNTMMRPKSGEPGLITFSTKVMMERDEKKSCGLKVLLATLHLLIGTPGWGFNAFFLRNQLVIHKLTTAKKIPVESPNMRMPVIASSGASIRHCSVNTRSP